MEPAAGMPHLITSVSDVHGREDSDRTNRYYLPLILDKAHFNLHPLTPPFRWACVGARSQLHIPVDIEPVNVAGFFVVHHVDRADYIGLSGQRFDIGFGGATVFHVSIERFDRADGVV